MELGSFRIFIALILARLEEAVKRNASNNPNFLFQRS